MLDEGVPSQVEAIFSATEDADPEPVKEVEVTEHNNPEDTLLVEPLSAPELALESPKDVKEVLVDAEPVVARPIPTLAIPEHVELVVEEAPIVNLVEDVIPNTVSEEKPTVEAKVPVTQPEEVEEPGPIVAESAEKREPSPGQEIPAPIVSELAVEPTNEEPVLSVPESDIPPAEPAIEQVPPMEPESAAEPQETEGVNPPAPSEFEEEVSVDPVEQEHVPLVISEPVEAEKDVLISDPLQEEARQVERPWTPSYSVSSQGGGLDDIVSTDEVAAEPTVVPELPVEELVAPAPGSVIPAEVRVLDI